ncbi:uncharacterized protein DS421_1g27550 [Arachis hypogaea]|nr:uncharacterized protein DS421_1g27550 [Arachis hypogaea]
MKCRRRNTIARSSISIATTLNSSQAFAVKSADLHDYKQLKTTQKILFTLISPQIVAYKSCDVTIENGIMHGNVKGQNDLVIAQGAKIADFGCALRWWLMVKHYLHDNDLVTVLYRIRFWDEVPKIPNHVSEEEKDFLTKYYKRDPSERGLVEELLVHGFVHAFNEHTDYKLELGSFEPLIYILPWVCWRLSRTIHIQQHPIVVIVRKVLLILLLSMLPSLILTGTKIGCTFLLLPPTQSYKVSHIYFMECGRKNTIVRTSTTIVSIATTLNSSQTFGRTYIDKQLKTEQEILSKLNYSQIVGNKDCHARERKMVHLLTTFSWSTPTMAYAIRRHTGIVYGDVKEQNDLVTTQRVKIADFDCTIRVVADVRCWR